MRKSFLFSLFAITIVCISCSNNSGSLSATAQKNLDAFHGVNKCFETKDFSNIGNYIAEDAIDHAAPGGEVKGLANLKSMFETWASKTENEKSETKVEMANDEYVMAWMHFTGTSKVDQPEMNLKAGESYDMNSVEVIKCKDGKITDHWYFMDPADMQKMMGGGQQMPMMPDTSKMMQQ